ncbi:ATP phosphoribosyltransferase 2 chloroplastic [Bienertia sinuspersici]
MGIADAILDLVSSGTTLRENNLKEIEGGVVLQSQGKWSVYGAHVMPLPVCLTSITCSVLLIFSYQVTANMRGSSAEEVAERIISQPSLSGLQGPTISPVFCRRDGKVTADYYAIVICVPKKDLYTSVQQLRAVSLSLWGLFIFYFLISNFLL